MNKTEDDLCPEEQLHLPFHMVMLDKFLLEIFCFILLEDKLSLNRGNKQMGIYYIRLYNHTKVRKWHGKK